MRIDLVLIQTCAPWKSLLQKVDQGIDAPHSTSPLVVILPVRQDGFQFHVLHSILIINYRQCLYDLYTSAHVQ